ncbi:MAG TPA: hypothetical protein VGB77_00020, partial [Abditibacteriaceae bacterium]
MVSILYAFLAASLLALFIHEITWLMRRRALTLMSVVGGLAFMIFIFGFCMIIALFYYDGGMFQPHSGMDEPPLPVRSTSQKLKEIG